MHYISSISLFLAAAIKTNGQPVSSSHLRTLMSSKTSKSRKAAANLVADIPPFTGVSCADVGASCTSADLLNGVGRSETNTNSDTIDACRDGVSGTQFVDESVEMITVSAVDGELQAGNTAIISAMVHGFNCALEGLAFPCDFAHFYATDNTNFPATWRFLETVAIDEPGLNELTVHYTLGEGLSQAVRVAFAFLTPAENSCPPADFSDVDDIAFSVAKGSGMLPAPHEAPAAVGVSTIESRPCSSFHKKGCSSSINCEWSTEGCSSIEN